MGEPTNLRRARDRGKSEPPQGRDILTGAPARPRFVQECRPPNDRATCLNRPPGVEGPGTGAAGESPRLARRALGPVAGYSVIRGVGDGPPICRG
jgi:hypothetical protein